MDEDRAGFSEVSGLGAEIASIEYRAGSDKSLGVRKLPGLVRYPNIILKRGVSGDTMLWDWINASITGQTQRLDGYIALLDEARLKVMQFRFRRGWPCRWEGPTLNAKSSSIAIETLEICHEGLEIEST
jgi:phage tail-like protein